MADYKIEIKKSAQKEIKNLPNKELKKVIDKIASLAHEPRPAGCKKLSGEEKYRIRVGSYRVLYGIEDDILVIYVVKVGHRKDVYE
ncbi:MAG: type II toxin-antitoxin system RelE/ParE family toxin [Sulfurovaceae bacterium]|nr:type II toxin-antitoxin system RelE/ParE family toxin [Sulfurovaceae bacterium]MDD5547996.1 type II toxin-antitoxin system RelE/ParE family toxin [Sulfurovaceae bacterium]